MRTETINTVSVKIQSTWSEGFGANLASELEKELKSWDYGTGATKFTDIIERAELIENGAYGNRPAIYVDVTSEELAMLQKAAERSPFTVKEV